MTKKQIVTSAILAVVTVCLPGILLWAFFETLFREIGRAFRYAWLEVRANVEAYRQAIREARKENDHAPSRRL